ncbi:hypothetical protein [Streptomyces sp. 1222.5]
MLTRQLRGCARLSVLTWAHTHRPLPAPVREALEEALRLHDRMIASDG